MFHIASLSGWTAFADGWNCAIYNSDSNLFCCKLPGDFKLASNPAGDPNATRRPENWSLPCPIVLQSGSNARRLNLESTLVAGHGLE